MVLCFFHLRRRGERFGHFQRLALEFVNQMVEFLALDRSQCSGISPDKQFRHPSTLGHWQPKGASDALCDVADSIRVGQAFNLFEQAFALRRWKLSHGVDDLRKRQIDGCHCIIPGSLRKCEYGCLDALNSTIQRLGTADKGGHLRASRTRCGSSGRMSFSIARRTAAGAPGMVRMTVAPNKPPTARLSIAAAPIS